MSGIIDVHSHILTKEYLDYVTEQGAAMEDGFRLPAWDEKSQLEMMDKLGIEWSVLSFSSPHPYFENDAKTGIDIIRRMNEFSAEVKKRNPDRIGFAASLPLPNIEAAKEEVIYALDELGADAIKFASNSRGLYLGDPSLDPIMEEMDKRGAVLIIHPHKPEPMKEGVYSAGPIPLFEFLCDTTRAVLNLIGHEVPVRYPNIKIIVPHCGSFLPNIVDRFHFIQPIIVAQGLCEKEIDIDANISKLYFDTAGTPVPENLPFLLTVAEPDHILYGSDYPFTPLEVVEKNNMQLMDAFEEDERLTPYRDKILFENARKLFGR